MKRIGEQEGTGWAIFSRKESRIAREHEVKLLIGEALAAWEQAGVLQVIDRQSPLCRGADCLSGAGQYLFSLRPANIEHLFLWLDEAIAARTQGPLASMRERENSGRGDLCQSGHRPWRTVKPFILL